VVPKVSDEYKEEKRKDLLRSALACFGEKGYEATTVDDIIRHAGVSKGMLYTYFSSKEEILLELLKQRTTRFVEEVRLELNRTSTYIEKVLVLIRRYRDTPLTDEQKQWTTVYLEYWLASSRVPDQHQLLTERYDMLIHFLADIIAEGKQQGAFRESLDATTAATLYWAVCDGATLHSLQTGDGRQATAMWHAAEEMLMGYLTGGGE